MAITPFQFVPITAEIGAFNLNGFQLLNSPESGDFGSNLVHNLAGMELQSPVLGEAARQKVITALRYLGVNESVLQFPDSVEPGNTLSQNAYLGSVIERLDPEDIPALMGLLKKQDPTVGLRGGLQLIFRRFGETAPVLSQPSTVVAAPIAPSTTPEAENLRRAIQSGGVRAIIDDGQVRDEEGRVITAGQGLHPAGSIHRIVREQETFEFAYIPPKFLDGEQVLAGGFLQTTEVTNLQYYRYVEQMAARPYVLMELVAGTDDWRVVSRTPSPSEIVEDSFFNVSEKLDAGEIIKKAGFVIFKIRMPDYSNFNPAFAEPDHPAVRISWYELAAMGAYYGLQLPAELFWEWAARTDRNHEYGTLSGTLTPAEAHYQTGNVEATAPVRSKPANRWGSHDMAGNVWEWQGDRVVSRTNSKRVLRGGSWYTDDVDRMRSSYRNYFPPAKRAIFFGGRLFVAEGSL